MEPDPTESEHLGPSRQIASWRPTAGNERKKNMSEKNTRRNPQLASKQLEAVGCFIQTQTANRSFSLCVVYYRGHLFICLCLSTNRHPCKYSIFFPNTERFIPPFNRASSPDLASLLALHAQLRTSTSFHPDVFSREYDVPDLSPSPLRIFETAAAALVTSNPSVPVDLKKEVALYTPLEGHVLVGTVASVSHKMGDVTILLNVLPAHTIPVLLCSGIDPSYPQVACESFYPIGSTVTIKHPFFALANNAFPYVHVESPFSNLACECKSLPTSTEDTPWANYSTLLFPAAQPLLKQAKVASAFKLPALLLSLAEKILEADPASLLAQAFKARALTRCFYTHSSLYSSLSSLSVHSASSLLVTSLFLVCRLQRYDEALALYRLPALSKPFQRELQSTEQAQREASGQIDVANMILGSARHLQTHNMLSPLTVAFALCLSLSSSLSLSLSLSLSYSFSLFSPFFSPCLRNTSLFLPSSGQRLSFVPLWWR